MRLLALAAPIAALLLPLCLAQALAEPPGNQILFGAWLSLEGGDSYTAFNQRIGQNASIFQQANTIPETKYNYTTGAGGPPNEYRVEQTETSAYFYLTVYPTTFDLRDADFLVLAQQLKNYTEVYNRTTFLRWAPEMQGIWFGYGNQPTAYLALWKQMYAVIKRVAPQTIIVWSPNTGQGYPYGQNFASILAGHTNPNAVVDMQLLDTNHDGQLTAADDPFGPYYPGDEYVDWIGLSIYYKGQNNQNAVLTDNHCADAWKSIDPASNYIGAVDFYATYCAAKPNKACMFSETGAAYHRNSTGGASLVQLQTSWLNSCTFNTTFYDAFPRIKAYMQFEYDKVEYDGGTADDRDYRVTNDTTLLPIFQSGLARIASRVQWATYRPAPSDIPQSGRPGNLPGGAASSQNASAVPVGVVFQTQRLQDFSQPTLFWPVSAAERLTASIALLATISALALGACTVYGRSER